MAVTILSSVNLAYSTAPLHLTHPDKRIPNQYIVVLKEQYGDSRDKMIQDLNSDYDVELISTFSNIFSGFTISMTNVPLKKVLEMKEVKYVEENQIGQITAVKSWGIDRIDARLGLDDIYNPKYSGAGVDIYVIDTGIRITHNDFGGRAAYGWDAVDKDMESDDCHGHGTHCSGSAGGTEYGVAKQANLIGPRAVNCLGFGPVDWVLECMEWVYNETRTGPRAVTSMSLAYNRDQAIDDAVDVLHNGGVPVIAGAANDDEDACVKSPAGSPQTYTIGGTDNTDTRAWFSNWGVCVDIFAPAVDIVSAHHLSDDAEATMSGTSMATPHTAGAAALLLEENPLLTPDEVHAKLTDDSTKDVISDIPSDTVNYFLYVEPIV
ncbi:alkaline serine exoprotease A-like [Glandiceps talaboti]